MINRNLLKVVICVLLFQSSFINAGERMFEWNEIYRRFDFISKVLNNDFGPKDFESTGLNKAVESANKEQIQSVLENIIADIDASNPNKEYEPLIRDLLNKEVKILSESYFIRVDGQIETMNRIASFEFHPLINLFTKNQLPKLFANQDEFLVFNQIFALEYLQKVFWC